jgi:hypothetical protein
MQQLVEDAAKSGKAPGEAVTQIVAGERDMLEKAKAGMRKPRRRGTSP